MQKRMLGGLLAFLLLCTVTVGFADTGFADGVYYEVFVRAFADSNEDGIGDIAGLTQKLNYLQELGIKGLWLMPIFLSPSYHGYDVIDYRAINPEYGTMDDFLFLLTEAHARGMRVLLDIPFNHTSSQHPWFLEKPEYYRIADEKKTDAYHQRDDGWYYGFFSKHMPDLNFDNPDVRSEIVDIAKFWLALGVDGFRLDATSQIYAMAEVSNRQEIEQSAAWWVQLREALQEDYPDCYLLGEAWEPLSKRAVLLSGLDSVVNFDVGERIIGLLKTGGSGPVYVQELKKIYSTYANVRETVIDAPFLTNHDQNRVYAMLGAKLEKAKMAANMLLTLPGNAILYYGEEIGMMGAKPDEEIRTPFLWGADDPLQAQWMPSKYNKKTIPLSEQISDTDSLYSHYCHMIALRSAHPALSSGKLASADVGNDIIIAYTLTAENETLLILHNQTGIEQQTTEGVLAPYQSKIISVKGDTYEELTP